MNIHTRNTGGNQNVKNNTNILCVIAPRSIWKLLTQFFPCVHEIFFTISDYTSLSSPRHRKWIIETHSYRVEHHTQGTDETPIAVFDC